LINIFGATSNDIIFISAGDKNKVNESLGLVRMKLGNDLNLIDKEKMNFMFITDFPLFERDVENDNWKAMHHVFSSPTQETEKFLPSDPGKVIGNLFDLVCNGVELGSGSIRIHRRDVQEKIFSVIGYSKAEVTSRFGPLLESFEFGAPPHGGMGLGIDRLVSIFASEGSIRDVISFPKTQSASDLLWNSPSPINKDQLKELNIKPTTKEDKNEN
jgi:aspartyl-tRNA synthetase